MRQVVGGLGGLQVEANAVEGFQADDSFGVDLLGASEVGRQLVHVGLGPRNLDTQLIVVQPSQHVTGTDRIAFFDSQ